LASRNRGGDIPIGTDQASELRSPLGGHRVMQNAALAQSVAGVLADLADLSCQAG
jgi:hypothetical protein